MAQKRAASAKIKVRRTVVKLALNKLLLAMEALDDRAILEQQVFVSSRLSPESFEDLNDDGGGAVILRFVRLTEFSVWQLDNDQFLILEDE